MPTFPARALLLLAFTVAFLVFGLTTSMQGSALGSRLWLLQLALLALVLLLFCALYAINARLRSERALLALNAQLEERVAARTAALQTALADQQELLALKGEVLGMVGHELRTPLTGVLTMTELLAAEVGGALTPRQHYFVATAHSAGEQLRETIDGIISYNHLLAGEVEIELESYPVAYLLEMAAAPLRVQAAAKGQPFSVLLTPPDLRVTTDARAFVQVLRRLLDNAVKFTPAGQPIGIEACAVASVPPGVLPRVLPRVLPGVLPGVSTVLPRTGPGAARVQICVLDSGGGFGGRALAELVHPLREHDGHAPRHAAVGGMGLAYVHHMLPLLGGELALASAEKGSRFLITLPGG